MQFTERRNVKRGVLIGISFLIVVGIIWQTYVFFNIFKTEERAKMELWAQSLKTINNADLETQDISLPSKIIQENSTIPIILVQGDSIVSHVNIGDSLAELDKEKLASYLQKFKKENEPVKMEISPGTFQYLYYGNSKLLNQLKYYPIALLTIIVMFVYIIVTYYRTSKLESQSKLWAGMAKETAHQIGTPLSSLIGWIEIMKADDVDETTVTEIEKDVARLQTIADRFSKIGSEPALETRDIIAETQESYEYLKSRFSNIDFSFKAPNHAIMVSFNPILHSWTIENLVKNAIDAMRGRGKLDVRISEDSKFVKIQVCDSGKGISKSQFKKVFEPGFTTKKRGWGLGLSLTKRIVEDYHKGRIKVLSSEINRGTIMQASFPKI
ncbi:HAMP domain-containing histidine kinase [Flavobacterium sp. MAH-1]|uniref:histidine kinase n=1 Tax=Flavobacterium agri TaxID=2743471 RepID=A0A7Y8Y2R6_9FLAO|nr:HAMP domain-containing sensor histidine kinase [Flavobacterium agri]NUY81510.1 HAMP domain-containing histidine kinase [Flavobacterium agri]NYA71534.1 HAMP domain-containing histidine kinase [Flavobacterium agri]